jgi:hypothetical protein
MADRIECWLCELTPAETEIRKASDGWGPVPPQYTCSECHTTPPADQPAGPDFDDLEPIGGDA